MDAPMIYHTAICQDVHRPSGHAGSKRSASVISAFERSLRRLSRIVIASFGNRIGRPTAKDTSTGK